MWVETYINIVSIMTAEERLKKDRELVSLAREGVFLVGYKSDTQNKNMAWFLPRPKKDRYKGGMPLYCEEWLIELATDILGKKPKLLSLFSGASKYGYKVDIKPETNPDLVADAHCLSDVLKEKFDLIIADPPYSTEEARQLYDTDKLSYSKWTAECDKLLLIGGLLVVYHKFVMPNPDPEKYSVVKRVFIGNRTYHTPRVAIFFKRVHKV